jgi:hypothetical protein
VSDEATRTAPQAGDDAQPQEGTSEQNTNPQAGEESSEERIPKSALNEKNRENAALRKRLKELEANQKQREEAEQTELEHATTRASELEERAQTLEKRVRRASFIESINLPNARAAWAVAQDLGLEMEFDDDDRLANADAMRKALKKEDPRLFGTGSADGGERSPAPVSSGDSKADFLANALGIGR